jgi:hypothetical protein
MMLVWLALGSAGAGLSLDLKGDTASVSLNCPESGSYFLACVYGSVLDLSLRILGAKQGEVQPIYLNKNYPLPEGGGLVAVFAVDENETGKYKINLISQDTGRTVISAMRSIRNSWMLLDPGSVLTFKCNLSVDDEPVLFLMAEYPVEFRLLAPGNMGIIPVEETRLKCMPFLVMKSGEYSFTIKNTQNRSQKVLFVIFNEKGRLSNK